MTKDRIAVALPVENLDPTAFNTRFLWHTRGCFVEPLKIVSAVFAQYIVLIVRPTKVTTRPGFPGMSRICAV